MQEDSFAKNVVEDMIREYANVDQVMTEYEGYDLWILDNGTTIRLPENFSRIPEQEVALIAEVKLQMGTMEYDYWLGQQ